MKTDPERSDYVGTSDAFAFECRLKNVSSRVKSVERSKGGNGSSGFSRTSFVFFFNLSRSFSLSVSSRFTDRSYYYIIITIITTTTVESGASRNYEPWKGEETANELKERERQEAEEGDEMKKLENKTKASKREMDLNAALDEMKSLSARHARMDFDGRCRETWRRWGSESGRRERWRRRCARRKCTRWR